MAFPQFRQAMQPIVRTYRRQACQSGLHPYTRQPLNLNQPYSPQMSQSSLPSSIPSQPSSSSLSSKLTPPPKDAQPRSANYPININDDNDHDKTKTVKKPKFEPACERCSKQGHNKPNCDTHQEKHFESKIVTGLMDVPRVSRPLSEPPRHT